jgi:hypothetical protein
MEYEHAGGPVAGGTYPAEIFADFMSSWLELREARRLERGLNRDDGTEEGITPSLPVSPTDVPSAEQAPTTTPETDAAPEDDGGGQGRPAPQNPAPEPEPPPTPAPPETPPPTGDGGGGGVGAPG